MVAVQSSWTLAFFDSAWFFNLHKYVSRSSSNASPVMDSVTCPADFLRSSSSDQSVKCDLVDNLHSRSRESRTVAAKDHSAPEEYCDKAALSLESTKSDFEEMKRVFQSFDDNSDDRICAKDLGRYMARLGYHISDEEARSMVASVDHDGDGRVDLDEFFTLYSSLVEQQQEEDEEETLLEAFQVFDKNADGYITARELQIVLLDLGMPDGKSLKTCEEMIRSVAVDGNGEIDISQFKYMMRSSYSSTICY